MNLCITIFHENVEVNEFYPIMEGNHSEKTIGENRKSYVNIHQNTSKISVRTQLMNLE